MHIYILLSDECNVYILHFARASRRPSITIFIYYFFAVYFAVSTSENKYKCQQERKKESRILLRATDKVHYTLIVVAANLFPPSTQFV